MRKASTVLLEQGTQAPSPAPDLIPAENEQQNLTGNSHSDWYNKRGHFKSPRRSLYRLGRQYSNLAPDLSALRRTHPCIVHRVSELRHPRLV